MSERRFDELDKQWLMLMFLAKQAGITVDEVKHFFQASAGRVTENADAQTCMEEDLIEPASPSFGQRK